MNMKKLRVKIVLGVFLSATVVFLLTIIVFGLSTQMQLDHRSDSATELISTNGGKLPMFSEYKDLKKDEQRITSYDEESPYRMRYFIAKTNDENDVVETDVEHIAAVDAVEAIDMAEDVLAKDQSTGYFDNYRYRVDKDNKMVVFLDCSNELYSIRMLLLFISLIALAFVVMITIVFSFLSKMIVKPFAENAKLQKQFVTDASHELKTPIAIISANAEVLAYKDGENEWINNITAQVTRISELVNELLTLNRLEEVDTVTDIETLDLSGIMIKTADSFEEVLKNKNCTFEKDVKEGVSFNGNHAQIERLVSVLTENASKYVSDGGVVRIGLTVGQRYTTMTFYNTCEIDPQADFTHLFDRFYRTDASRTSKTGGHGIGLSIAKRIVDLHNGTISAIPQNDGLLFQVRLSNKLKKGKRKQSK